MTEQNKETAQVGIKYTSEGYAETIKELQQLQKLIKDVNTAANEVQGGTRAVKGMQNSLSILQSLNLGSQVFGGPKQNFEQRALAEAMSKLIANVQQHSKLEQNQLRLLAYTGQLSQEQLNLHKGNTETLKAIQAGYNDALRGNSASVKQNKLQLELHNQVTKILEDTVKQKKNALRTERANETKKRLQERKVALRFAEEVATKGGSKGLTGYIGQASKVQLEALERALNAQTLKDGGFDKRAIESALKQVSQAKTALSFGTQIIDPSKVIDIIRGSKGQKGIADQAIAEFKREIKRQTNLGRTSDELRPLYQILADAKTAYAEIHRPASPYQENKKANEATAAKMPLLSEAQIKSSTKVFDLEQQLRASKIRAKDTAVTFGSDKQIEEDKYQKALRARLSELNAEATKQKRDDAKPAGLLEAEKTLTQNRIQSAITLSDWQKKALATQDLAAQIEAASSKNQLKHLQNVLNYQEKIRGISSESSTLQEKLAKRREEINKKASEDRAKETKAKRDEAKAASTVYGESLTKIKSGDVLGGLEGLSLRQLKKLQSQLFSHLDLTGLDVKAKENLKKALGQIENTLKAEAKKPNIFQKARQGELSVEDLKNYLQGVTDPKRTLREYRSLETQLRKAELDPNLLGNSADTSPTRLLHYVRQQISSLERKQPKTVRQVLSQNQERLTEKNLENRLANQTLNEARLESKVNAELLKRKAINEGIYHTREALQALDSHGLHQAKATLNYQKKIYEYDEARRNQALSLLEVIKDIEKSRKPKKEVRERSQTEANKKLSENREKLLELNLQDNIRNQGLAQARLSTRVKREQSIREDILNKTYGSEDKLRSLRQEEIRHAKAVLNYQYNLYTHDKLRRDETAKLLLILKEVENSYKGTKTLSQTIANLAQQRFKTEAELKNLTKDESALAMRVIAHRRDKLAVGEAEWIAQQKLYDLAQRQHQLETIRAHTRDRERQEARREGQREHVLGDAGASLMLIQGALKINYAMLGGVQSIFSGAFDAATKLDSAFRNLQAISASTNAEMATMKVNLINVAQASKFSAAEVGETAVLLAQAGLSIQEIGASMKGILTLAQATGTDLAKSVDVITSVLSIFNKSATETDTIVNQLTQALNSSKLDIQKMALGLQYAGNIANDSGVSFEELTAALGATANAGIRSGSTLGTGLRQIFIDLQKPSEKLQARLTQLGISLDQVNFRSQGLEGVLRNLREAGFTSADAFATFEVRSAAAFSALSGNLDDFHQLQEELLDTNAAFEANNVQMESLAVQIDHLKSNLGILAAEGLKPITALLRDLAKATSHAMENAEEGSGVLQVFSTALTSILFGVAIGWMAKMAVELAKIVLGLKSATLAATGFWARLGVAAPVLVGITAAIGLATAAFVSHSNEVERLNTVLDKLKAKYNASKEALNNTESNLTNLDASIEKLNARYGVLIENQEGTTNIAKELRREFAGLGLEIDNLSTIKLPELIAKMAQLRREQEDLKQVNLAQALKDFVNQQKGTVEAGTAKRKATGFYLSGAVQAQTAAELINTPAVRYVPYARGGKTESTVEIRDVREAVLKDPKVKQAVIDTLKGLSTAYTTKGLFTDSQLNPSKLKTNLDLALASSTLTPANRRVVEEFTQKLFSNIQSLVDEAKLPEKIAEKTKTTQREIALSKIRQLVQDDPKYAQGAVEKLYQEFSERIAKNTANTPDVKQRGVNAVAIAKDVHARMKANETVVVDMLKAATEAGKDQATITALTDQLTAIRAKMSEVEKATLEDKKELLKRQLLEAETELLLLKEQEALAKKIHARTTGLNNQAAKASIYRTAFENVKSQELKIFKLQNQTDPNLDLLLGKKRLEQEAERKQFEIELQDKRKEINDRAKKNEAENIKDAIDADLEKRSKAHQDFLAAQKERDRAFQETEESLARQHKAGKYRPLVNTDMTYLNKEEKKRAQAAANATGVAQEYSVFGQIKNNFARQGENYRQEQNETAIAQRKLLHNLEQLQTAELIKQSFNLKEYNNLLKQQALQQAAVEKLKADAQNADKDFDQTKLDAAETELKALNEKITLQAKIKEETAQEVRERELAVRLAQDELDKLKEKWGVMSTTMLAGVQSLESGMSTIFSDWASGVIQNTEDVRDAFEQMGKSILQSMLKVVSDKLAQQFVGFLLNTFGGLGGASGASAPSDFGAAIVGQTPSISFGMAKGGLVKRFAEGGFVSGNNIGRDSVPALLMPDEYVLQRSAVSALGKPFLDNLNQVTAGSISQGKTALTGSAPQINNVMKSSPPVNVYVVAPEQQRQMSQQDVVVALQDDILRNGQTKKLIKGIITGEV